MIRFALGLFIGFVAGEPVRDWNYDAGRWDSNPWGPSLPRGDGSSLQRRLRPLSHSTAP